MKSPIHNSAVEYATLSEINRNNLFIYRFPDLRIRNADSKIIKTDNFSAETLPSPKSLSFSSAAEYAPGGTSIQDTLRDRNGVVEDDESLRLIETGVCGGSWYCWNDPWRENANLRSLAPSPKSALQGL